jgi:Tol biopolymer transport system component
MKRYAAILLLALAACKKDHQQPGPDLSVDPTLLDNTPAEVVFISRRIDNSADWQLYGMNMDGTNQRLLSDRIVQCAPVTASNDGQKITFNTYENNRQQLYVLDKATGTRKLLATNDEYISNAVWSPDNSKLLFTKAINVNTGAFGIFTVDSDGSNEKEIKAGISAGQAQWFPDGQSIGFIGVENGVAGVYAMRLDGSEKKRLTPAGQRFGSFRISPTGEQIVLIGNDQGGSQQLFLMNAKGGATRQVTTSVSPRQWPGNPRDGNNSPAWSPDGSKIAYVSWANETPDIFIMDANGKNDKRLTSGAIRDESPQWSRDGKYIYFNSNRDMSLNHEIYRMTPDGKNQIPLTHWRSDDSYPVIIKK